MDKYNSGGIPCIERNPPENIHSKQYVFINPNWVKSRLLNLKIAS